MPVDFNVYADTRISNLPRLLRPAAVLVREVCKPFRTRIQEKASYVGDGIRTTNNCDFLLNEKFKKAYAKTCQSFGAPTLNIQWRVHQALWCVSIARRLEGDFIELGVGKGLIMSSVLEVYDDWETSGKKLLLVDTFSPYSVDQSTGEQHDGKPVNNFYAKSLNEVKSNFATFPNVEFVIGKVPDILSSIDSETFSFVHIDMNFHVPEVAALTFLWDKIVKGGVVLLDDYAYRGHSKQYDAINQLAEKLKVNVLTTATGQGIIIK